MPSSSSCTRTPRTMGKSPKHAKPNPKAEIRKRAHALFSVFTAVALVVSLTPIPAAAEIGKEGKPSELSGMAVNDRTVGQATEASSDSVPDANADDPGGNQGSGQDVAGDGNGKDAVGKSGDKATAKKTDEDLGEEVQPATVANANGDGTQGEAKAAKESSDANEADKADDDKDDPDIVDEGANVHEEDGLYEVELFGATASNEDLATEAIIEKSAETAGVDNVEPAEARMMTRMLFAPLAANNAPSYPYPRRADGSDVEAISIRWITKDTEDNGDDSLLYLVPDGDSAFSVRFQVDYALSGEHHYEPGDIQIRIPAQVFHKRNSWSSLWRKARRPTPTSTGHSSTANTCSPTPRRSWPPPRASCSSRSRT